jgi:phosphate uptake regulator
MNCMTENIPTGMMSPEAERYFGVILEDINGKFQTLLEGQASLDERMARLEVRMDRLELRMDELEAEMIAFKVEMKKDLAEIRAELKLCARQEDLIALEKRVSNIEQVLRA